VTTRALETMGAEFGERLLPPIAGINDKGFFEDVDINRINIELMTAAGTSWHTAGPIDLGTIDRKIIEHQQKAALELLMSKTKGRTFALKDPRMARLLPFWQTVFDLLSIRVAYVVAVRNPMSVCRSLQTWNKFSDEKCYLLWLAHTVPALRATEGRHRTLVDYDQLLDHPRAHLLRMANDLNLQLDHERVVNFAEEFLDAPLRHSRFSMGDLDTLGSAARQVRDLFYAVQTYIANPNNDTSSDYLSALSAAESYLNDIAPALRYQWRLEQEIEQLDASLRNALEQGDSLNKTLRDQRESISSLEGNIAEARTALKSAHRLLATMEQSMSWRITAPLRRIRRQLFRTH
jgi:hypothetical protein